MADPITIFSAVINEQTITAAMATLLSSIIIKFVEGTPDRNAAVIEEHLNLYEEHNKLREELRLELQILRDEIKALKEEVDEWRDKYYSQVETTNELLFEVATLKEQALHNTEKTD